MKIVIVVCFLAMAGGSSVSIAQNPAPSAPQPLDATSIIKLLDESSLAQARIGIETDVDESLVGDLAKYDTMLSESAIFSGGFRVKSLTGCKLTLRNENVELLEHMTGSYNPTNTRLKDLRRQGSEGTYYSEIVIPLSRLSEKNGPSQSNSKRAVRLGKWRMEFKTPRFNSTDGFLVGVRSRADEQFYTSMWGETLIIRFDDKTASYNFRAAFMKAIGFCNR